MGQSGLSDWLLQIEAAVLEALAGRRAFPIYFYPSAEFSASDLREFCRRLCGLDPRILVVLSSDGGSLPDRVEVSTLERDPNPPPGLEGYPMLLNGRRAI